MKTQSADTHPDAERMLIHLIRNAPINRRFRLIQSLTQGALWSNMRIWREQHPNISEREAAVQAVSRWYGPALAVRVEIALARQEQWSLQSIDLPMVMLPALHLFEERNIVCYLGGSIASSLYGMQQMAQDIDLVVDLHIQELSSLSLLLKQVYIFDEDALQEAVCQRTSCPLLHLDTLMKIDLVMTKRTTLEHVLQERRVSCVLDERCSPFWIASAVEMILIKLHRYSQKKDSQIEEMRDDEWNDIMGMLKVQGPDLEKDFLEDWARILQMTETLRLALIDAGIEDEEAI